MTSKIHYLILALLLVAGFLVRLYKIENPVADWHSWRQADTSAVTRNYVKYGVDLLYPRYDDFSDVSGHGLFNPLGFRFVEFPVFNLLHFGLFSLGSIFYGTLEFWGRMTSILAALGSSIFLFLIVRRQVSAIAGLLSAAFYLLLPFNIYFTRVILPDPLMVTLFLAALYFHLSNHKLLTLIFGALAILVKPLAIFFLLPIYLKDFRLGLIMLAPFGAWRLWSYRHPEGIPASLWLLNGNKIRFRPAFFQWIFGTRIGILILGKWGLWPFLHGFFVQNSYFSLWTVGALVYLFTFATGNVQHDYYQTPIMPIISVFLGLGTVKLWAMHDTYLKNWLHRFILIFSLACMFLFAWYDIRGLYQVNNWAMVHAGVAVDRLTPKDSVVVAPYGGDTAFLYQTNRPGFPFMTMPIKDMIDRYSADYYVSLTLDGGTKDIMNKYIVIEEKPEYVIVKLEEPIRP